MQSKVREWGSRIGETQHSIIKPPNTVDAAGDGETHSSFMYHGKRIKVHVRAFSAQCLSFSQANAKVSPPTVSQRDKRGFAAGCSSSSGLEIQIL